MATVMGEEWLAAVVHEDTAGAQAIVATVPGARVAPAAPHPGEAVATGGVAVEATVRGVELEGAA